jgi:Protein of unknown function (DUF1018)
VNEAQLRLYRYEWGRCRKWLRAHGRTPERADAMRHEIHKAAIGFDKSSLDLTNAELDKVLAKFRSYSEGDNLDAQLAAEDQPAHRKQALVANVRELAAGVVDREGTEAAYLDGLARRMFKVPEWHALSERQLQVLRGVVTRRKRQLAKGGNPF